VPVVVDPGMGIRRMVSCLRESRPRAFVGIPAAHVLRTFYPKYFKTVKTSVTVGGRWFWGGHGLKQIRRLPWRPYPMADTRRDDIAAVLFTTGSTGPAKGAVYTHGTFDAQIRIIRSHFDIGPDEIDLPTFPLFALFDPALGMTAVIPDMDPTRPAYVNPRKIIGAITDHGVTNMFASPALLNRVGAFGRKNKILLKSLKRVVSAGAPVYPTNIEQFSGLLTDAAEIHTPYGATEAVPVISIGSHEILSETRDATDNGYGICIGRPIDGIDVQLIRVTDAPLPDWSEDLPVPDGEIGEITVKGELVSRAYFERPEADAQAKIQDGDTLRHRMGDLGWKDRKGRIWYCGRKSHRVVTPSGILFTIPCEAIFNTHPQVLRSALVGVGAPPYQIPVICIEIDKSRGAADRKRLNRELLELAAANELTRSIETVLFHRAFPVDIRHNAKIFREQLAVWATGKVNIRGSSQIGVQMPTEREDDGRL
jgi:acyl-coenzyme A synthetase/AMP-(fatty) acid ligase